MMWWQQPDLRLEQDTDLARQAVKKGGGTVVEDREKPPRLSFGPEQHLANPGFAELA